MKKEGSLQGKEVVLGVTGSIAAYKAAEVASRLVQRGAGVTVVMTRAATQFVGPLTFQALTRRRVLIEALDPETVLDPVHVTLAEKAGVVVVAPATANFLGKAAHGIADDLLTSLILAVECPILVAPAMNDRMWKNAAVQENLGILRKRGFRFVEPETGFLACGTYAKGRLADPERIVAGIGKILSRRGP
jgi:phosphopantothenoylcysteine decarboxylase/phosphopantothenate--cysteine ligase